MRFALVLLATLLLLAPLSGAAATPAPEPAAHEWPPAAAAIFALPDLLASAPHLTAASKLQIEPARPPALVYRDADAPCDLDGDGVVDLLSNDLDLLRPPTHAAAGSRVRAISGATGESLWSVDNLAYYRSTMPAGFSYELRGQAFPDTTGNVASIGDINDDGACDILAYGYDDRTGFGTPILGTPSVTFLPLQVRVLSGRDGATIWTLDMSSTSASANDPLLGTHRASMVSNFLSGLHAYETAEGTRILVKTSDVEYIRAQDPVGIRGINLIPQTSGILKDRAHYEDVRVTEHLQLVDAASGQGIWQRDLTTGRDSGETNLTWISGTADITGDGELDILLDQLSVTTPRASELNNPVTGSTFTRYGRGMRVLALDGLDGTTRWMAPVLETLPVETIAPEEENHETLTVTRAQVAPDLDGDGIPDVIASYLAQEERMGATVNGAYRTHFVALSGADGALLWDVRQQGWGRIAPLSPGILGIGMVDVPSDPTPGGRFPPKFVRMLAIDALDGATRWSYEKSFAQNSYLSYNLALSQYDTALAPNDWDGDGVLDLVTPAQYAPVTGNDQLLLATSSHTYDVLSGYDGHVISTLRAWGPDGRILACEGASDKLTVISGHARRSDITRFDVTTGATLWRVPWHNDPAPRAATTAIDMTGLGATCRTSETGTLLAVNLQAYSLDRRHEVIPILGRLDATGATAWMTPAVRGEPRTDILFQASVREASPPTGPVIAGAIVAGVAAGAALAAITLSALARRTGAVASAMMLILLVASVFAPLAAAGATLPALEVPVLAPAPPPSASTVPSALTEAAPMRAMASLPLPAAAADPPPGFGSNATLSFTHDLGDVDGDGTDDLLIDQYCDDFAECYNFIPLDQLATYALSSDCGPTHFLVAVSGADGSVLWTRNLAVPAPILSCGQNVLIGTVPFPSGGRGIVTYNFTQHAFTNLEQVTDHRIEMMNATTGEILWTFDERGTYVSTLFAAGSGTSISLRPIVFEGPEPALLVQGIGYTMEETTTIFGALVTDGAVRVTDHYMPQEWAARLDVETGEVLWRVDTFTPDAQRSVLPKLWDGDGWSKSYGPDSIMQGRYWSTESCCDDVTGDGVPDLIYHTYEWSPYPSSNTQGPYFLDARLVAISGADGSVAWSRFLREDLDVPNNNGGRDYEACCSLNSGFGYIARTEPLGDVDADGARDLLVYETLFDYEHLHAMSVVSGRTGETLWMIENERRARGLILGDADDDGAPDILLVDWYGWEFPSITYDNFVEPQGTPLTLYSGATGARIWQVTTFAAPADVVELFGTLARNGIPDVNGDGVGDVPIDAPEYLGDQTVIHKITIVSGRDASPLHTMTAVGAFAFPAAAADLTGDGIDDIALLSGDVNDLWLTIHDGTTGNAAWARRILAVPASGYAQALPRLKLHALDGPDGAHLVINFHLFLMRATTYYGIYISGTDNSAGETISLRSTLSVQLMAADGATGRLAWALPEIADEARLGVVRGATPGTQAFLELASFAGAGGTMRAAGIDARPLAMPAFGGFAASYLAILLIGLVVLRLRARDKGVPELD